MPVTPTTLFHVASVTKSFTAVAVLKLMEAGKLKLDDPIGRVVCSSFLTHCIQRRVALEGRVVVLTNTQESNPDGIVGDLSRKYLALSEGSK